MTAYSVLNQAFWSTDKNVTSDNHLWEKWILRQLHKRAEFLKGFQNRLQFNLQQCMSTEKSQKVIIAERLSLTVRDGAEEKMYVRESLGKAVICK